MTEALLQGGADIPRYTATQRYTALAIVLVVLALAVLLRYRMTYVGLEESQARHKAALLRAKSAISPVSMRIPATTDLEAHRDGIAELVDAARNGEMPDHEPATLRGAAIETHAAIGEALRQRFEGISRLAITVGETGLAVAILGSIAVSTGAVVGLLQDGPSMDVGAAVGAVGDLTASVFATGTELLFQFPFVDILWALLLTVLIIGTQWAYEHWHIWAALLLGLAVAIAVLDRRVTDDVQPTPASRVERTSLVFGAILLIWLAGVVPTALGEAAGIGTIGAVVGFLLALVTFGYFVVRGLRGVWRRIKRGARRHADAENSRLLATYLALRQAGLSLAVGVSPLLVIYLFVVIVSGRGMRVVNAVLGAPLETKAIILLGVLLAAGALAYAAREAEADLRSGIAEALSIKAVRIGLLARGMPVGFALLGAITAYSITGQAGMTGVGRLAATALVGIAFGLFGRGVSVAFLRARHRISLLGDDEPVPTSLLVESYVLPDADGDEHLFVRINGSTRLAWSDPEAADVVDTVLEVGEQIAVDGEAEPTVAEWRADDLLELGIVDPEETHKRLHRMIHEDAVHNLLREKDVVDRGTFDDAIADYPEPVREEWLTRYKRHSAISERDGNVILEHDPHAA